MNVNVNIYKKSNAYINERKWRCSPVSAGLLLKERVEPLHLAGWDEEEGQVTVGHTDSLDQPVQRSLRVAADLRRRAPENDGRALWEIEELGGFADHTEDAGMSHDAHCWSGSPRLIRSRRLERRSCGWRTAYGRSRLRRESPTRDSSWSLTHTDDSAGSCSETTIQQLTWASLIWFNILVHFSYR